MTKLDELMELNKSVDTIINSAMEDKKRTEKEITATKIELWNKMWDDIEEWYNKGYVDIIKDHGIILEVPYGYYDRTVWTYCIKLCKHTYKTPCIYLDMGGGHTEIKRYHGLSLINNECWGEYITTLLLCIYTAIVFVLLHYNYMDNKAYGIVNIIAIALTMFFNYNNSLLKSLKGEN